MCLCVVKHAISSDRLSFVSVEIVKSCSLPLPPWKNLCNRRSRDQSQPGSFFQRSREEEKIEPGNDVGVNIAL